LYGERECLLAIAGGDNVVPFGDQPDAVDFSQGLVILD
jgi:hypothetical protein